MEDRERLLASVNYQIGIDMLHSCNIDRMEIIRCNGQLAVGCEKEKKLWVVNKYI